MLGGARAGDGRGHHLARRDGASQEGRAVDHPGGAGLGARRVKGLQPVDPVADRARDPPAAGDPAEHQGHRRHHDDPRRDGERREAAAQHEGQRHHPHALLGVVAAVGEGQQAGAAHEEAPKGTVRPARPAAQRPAPRAEHQEAGGDADDRREHERHQDLGDALQLAVGERREPPAHVAGSRDDHGHAHEAPDERVGRGRGDRPAPGRHVPERGARDPRRDDGEGDRRSQVRQRHEAADRVGDRRTGQEGAHERHDGEEGQGAGRPDRPGHDPRSRDLGGVVEAAGDAEGHSREQHHDEQTGLHLSRRRASDPPSQELERTPRLARPADPVNRACTVSEVRVSPRRPPRGYPSPGPGARAMA